MNLFVVPTISFDLLYAFFIIAFAINQLLTQPGNRYWITGATEANVDRLRDLGRSGSVPLEGCNLTGG
jgi:hypothetical protein